MNKSRKGAALIMALVVVLLGGALVALILNTTLQHSMFSTAGRASFVDHTTVLHHIQTERARILETNIAAMAVEVRSTNPALFALQSNWRTDFAPGTEPELGLDVLRISQETRPVGDGVGRDEVRVSVYDLFFDPSWLDIANMSADELRRLPPAISVFGEADGPWIENHPGSGIVAPDAGGTDVVHMPPQRELFGVYLVRVELFERLPNGNLELVRLAEEAFAQVF